MPISLPDPPAAARLPERAQDEDLPLVLPGQIFWVPEKEVSGAGLKLHKGAYNHPCVILSDRPRGREYTFVLITSLTGQSLEDREFTQDFKARVLPISPTPKHHDNGILLHLEHGHEMKRHSYVNANKRYKADIRHLRRYEDGVRCFTKESLQTIIDKAGFKEVPPPRVDSRMDNDAQDGVEPTSGGSRESHAPELSNADPRRKYLQKELRAIRNSLLSQISKEHLGKLKRSDVFMKHKAHGKAILNHTSL